VIVDYTQHNSTLAITVYVLLFLVLQDYVFHQTGFFTFIYERSHYRASSL